MCTTGDTAHIDTIFKLLPHTRHWCTHRTSLVVKKKLFQFFCGCEKFHYGRSFGFLAINVCNHGEHYETPSIWSGIDSV